SMANPITNPPIIAPNAVPRPPNTTAANMPSSNLKPICHWTCSETPNSTPPSAANPPPIIQTITITRSTSIPDDRARSGLSATARIAVPSFVFSSSSPTPTSTATEIATIHIVLGTTLIGSNSEIGDWTANWLYDRG